MSRDGNEAIVPEGDGHVVQKKTNVPKDGGSGHWNDCTFEVVMIDNRTLPSEANPETFWGMTAVINHEYAKKFGYKFTLVHPDYIKGKEPDYDVNWLKPLYFAQRLQELKESTRCKWFLFLDSDAFVREFDVPLEKFIPDLLAKYNIPKNVAAVFAKEKAIPGVSSEGHLSPPIFNWLNPGVFLVQANAQSQFFFNAWLEGGQHSKPFDASHPALRFLRKESPFFFGHFPGLRDLRKQWPAEMGVLTQLYENNQDIKSMLGTVDMLEMNSPSGKFVEHAWGGWGSEKKKTDFSDMLARIGTFAEPGKFSKWLGQVEKCTVSWTPTPWAAESEATKEATKPWSFFSYLAPLFFACVFVSAALTLCCRLAPRKH